MEITEEKKFPLDLVLGQAAHGVASDELWEMPFVFTRAVDLESWLAKARTTVDALIRKSKKIGPSIRIEINASWDGSEWMRREIVKRTKQIEKIVARAGAALKQQPSLKTVLHSLSGEIAAVILKIPFPPNTTMQRLVLYVGYLPEHTLYHVGRHVGEGQQQRIIFQWKPFDPPTWRSYVTVWTRELP